MSRKRTARMQRQNVGASPVWLKTVAIAKPGRGQPLRGSFGAASVCVTIDPLAGLPKAENCKLGGDDGAAGVNP